MSISELPGLDRAPAAPVLFDNDPIRNVDQVGISYELPQLPDDRLIATLISLECPRWFAEQVRTSHTCRFQAVAVWCLVQDALEGKSVMNARTGEVFRARELVDGIREQYREMRRIELVADRPDMSIGMWER